MQKTCKIHGALLLEDIGKHKRKNGFILECNICKRISSAKMKEKYKERHIERIKVGYYDSIEIKKICYRHGDLPRDKIWITSTGLKCSTCRIEATRNYEKKFPEKHEAYKREYRDKVGSDLWQKKAIISKRKISLDEYLIIEKTQNGKCDICKLKETRTSRTGRIARLCLDHSHTTGSVRALICHRCNQMIGLAKDNIQLLKNAISYLERHKHIMDDLTGVNHE